MGYLSDIYDYATRPKVLLTLALSGISAFVAVKYYQSLPEEVSLTAFLSAVSAKAVRKVVDHGDTAVFTLAEGVVAKVNIATLDKSELVSKCAKTGVDYISKSKNKLLIGLAMQLGSLGVLLAGLFYLQWRQGTPKKQLEHKTNVHFKDIAGNCEAKQALTEIIDYFKDSERFVQMGASLPRGVLLFGPSGTGKTMLAKATACEAKVNFIECSGSEFIEMFVGVGARRVRDVFQQARESSPCILFIDEIECLAVKRGLLTDRSNMEHHSTLNQLLTEMDGFRTTENIVVLGATNKHLLLDEAILRPGRFDRKITVNLPDREARLEILKLGLLTRKHQVSEEMLAKVADTAVNSSGAELISIVNEAAFDAIRKGKTRLTDEEVQDAMQKFVESARQFQPFEFSAGNRSIHS